MFTLESFILNERTPVDNNGVGIPRSYDIRVGEIGDTVHFDPGLMRPYRDERGTVWVDVCVGNEVVKDSYNQPVYNKNGQLKYRPVYDPQPVAWRRSKDLPVINITSNALVLTRDQWKMIDTTVATASRKRLIAWNDLRANNTMGGFDGMATPILEFQRMGDAGEAVVDMDGVADGHDFTPPRTWQGMPLPVTHADFYLSQRFLSVSRARGGPAADTTNIEMAGRRIGETLERTYLGTQTGVVYGDDTTYSQTSAVYGLTNHPERITVTGATAPAAGNGATLLTEWLAQREQFYSNNFYGPFFVYTATNYDQFLDNLFSSTEPAAGTTRSQLMAIQDINAIRRVDYLTTAGTSVWVQMGENIKAVNGMDITVVQWQEKGGMKLQFKVLTIQAPMIRSVAVNNSATGPASASGLKAPIVHVTV